MTGHADADSAHPSGATPATTMRVLIYSDNANTRQEVVSALGRRPSPELPQIETVEVATEPALIRRIDAGGLDVIVLDGESAPAGGMGICRQIKDEIYRCPPVLVLLGREQDAWLASWSRADSTVAHPLNPIEVAGAVAALMRQRLASAAVRG
jgi:DNA-binding response OmpR family regulator